MHKSLKHGISILSVITLSCLNSYAQNDITAVAFGATYSVYNRAGLGEYLTTVSDSMHLPSSLKYNPDYGIHLHFIKRKGKGEFEGGLSYSFSFSQVSSDSGYSFVAKTHDIGIIMGGNYVPVPFLFVGGQFIINAFGGDLKHYKEVPDKYVVQINPGPSTNFNIFKGYSVMARAQAGFNIPFNAEYKSGLRLFGYYDIGSPFNFFNAMDTQLTAYSGNKKTFTNGWGCGLMFYVNIKK